MQFTRRAFSLDLLNAGSSRAARMAIIAMTTSNSIQVKADLRFIGPSVFWICPLFILQKLAKSNLARLAQYFASFQWQMSAERKREQFFPDLRKGIIEG